MYGIRDIHMYIPAQISRLKYTPVYRGDSGRRRIYGVYIRRHVYTYMYMPTLPLPPPPPVGQDFASGTPPPSARGLPRGSSYANPRQNKATRGYPRQSKAFQGREVFFFFLHALSRSVESGGEASRGASGASMGRMETPHPPPPPHPHPHPHIHIHFHIHLLASQIKIGRQGAGGWQSASCRSPFTGESGDSNLSTGRFFFSMEKHGFVFVLVSLR